MRHMSLCLPGYYWEMCSSAVPLVPVRGAGVGCVGSRPTCHLGLRDFLGLRHAVFAPFPRGLRGFAFSQCARVAVAEQRPPTRATHATMPARLLYGEIGSSAVPLVPVRGAGVEYEGSRPTCRLAFAPFWRAAMAAFREVPRGFWSFGVLAE